MNAMSEQTCQTATVSLAEMLCPNMDRPAAAGVAYHGQYVEGLDAPIEIPGRDGALSRLLRNLATRLAAWRERRAVINELTAMSDRDLADIGLSRAQIHQVFDPEFSRARNGPYRAAAARRAADARSFCNRGTGG